MEALPRDQVCDVNGRLRAAMERGRNALAGRQNFTAEDVRALLEIVGQMAPIVANMSKLRSVPQIESELFAYKQNLIELREITENLRFMLVARRTRLASKLAHIKAVGSWTTALNQTR